MLCNECTKRNNCVKMCKSLEKHLKKDIEVSRRERLECEIKPNIEEIIGDDFPAGEIELNTSDWLYMLKHNTLTKLQRKYIYLYYWKRLSYKQIGKKYKVSKQNICEIIMSGKDKISLP